MSRYGDLILLILAAFILGIGLRSILPDSIWIWFFLNLSLISLVFFFFLTYEKEKSAKIFLFGCLVILALTAGLWRFDLADEKSQIAALEDQVVEFSGVVTAEPQIADGRTRYTVAVEDDRILITADQYPAYDYGDQIAFRGQLQRPAIFDDFDYQAYLQKEGISWVMYYPEIDLLSVGEGNQVIAGLLKFKDQLRQVIFRSLASPQDNILQAMILGDRDHLPTEVEELFSRIGIRHIVAISGLHITIVASILLIVLSRFLPWSKDRVFYFVIATLFTYVLLVGAPPSAVRAGIMASLLLLAEKLGRPYFLQRALLVAAFVMLIFNPLLLSRDVGFQLSFTAVLGIYYISPIIEYWLKKIRLIREKTATWLTKTASVTVGAQLAVSPLIAYHFDLVSLIAPIANVLVVPTMPVLITVGLFGALLGYVYLPLAQIILLPIDLLLQLIMAVSQSLDTLPYSSFQLGLSVSLPYLLLSYLALSLAISWIRKKFDISTKEYGIILKDHR